MSEAHRHGPEVSVVAPMYNEAPVLEEFYHRCTAVMRQISSSYELVLVDDGSVDATVSIARQLASSDPRVKVLILSRNFGKETALTAGLDHAGGAAVIPIDADLQDPPEIIPALIERWRAGYDVVYAVRTARKGEPWLKRATAAAFYKILSHAGEGKYVPPNTGDFRLMSRRVVDAVCSMRERHRFMKGLFALVGFRHTSIEYERDPRFAGETKWSYLSLLGLSVEGLTSFTMAPLRAVTVLGLATGLVSLVYAGVIIYKTLKFGEPVAGYPSLMVVVLFIGSVQMMSVGIIGEYLGRVFNETKQRPLYFVDEFVSEADVVSVDGQKTEASVADDLIVR